jgi:sigma-B regulation protein RsbU (phosphoserine phosphatase)
MANTRAYLRTLVRFFTDVGDIVTTANQMLSLDTEGHGFVTLFFAELDPQQRTFSYAAAGHQAYYVTTDDHVTNLSAAHPPLGIVSNIEIPSSSRVSLNEGELLVMMTDGIPETMSSDGSMLGIPRALDVVRNHRDQSAQAIVDALYRESLAFADDARQNDDITVVVVKGGKAG